MVDIAPSDWQGFFETGTKADVKWRLDAEAVVDLSNNRFFDHVAAFEGRNRLDYFASEGDVEIEPIGLKSFDYVHHVRITPGPALGDTSSLKPNQGLEALALLQDGTLIAGAESPTVLGRAHPVWRFPPTGDPEHPFADAAGPSFKIASEPGYGLVGFDVTPAGHLLVLQRFHAPRIGYKTKIGWIPKREIENPEGTLRPRTLARLDGNSPVPVDNFEGIAASQGPDGETLIWIVSDDNFSAKQKTLLYVFSFDDAGFAARDAATH